jgi:membrane peptidoglycan carboxypeptidase
VGPATPSYVPLERIPEPVWQAALATEDMGFFKHQGFKLGLIKRAIVLNLDKGWYVYGGSTISQQLVKNLFLSREKTLSRKLEEAIIVWQMERRLTKERILELYLNCIEYGKRIYGVQSAAKAYFNKAVEDLTPVEGAFLMATKPAPTYAYGVYEKRQFNRWWAERMKGILVRLWKEMNVLSEKQVAEAAPYLPLFWYPADGVYAYPAVDSSALVPPGMPVELPRELPSPVQVPSTAPQPAM